MNKSKTKLHTELFITLLIGIWVFYRLSKDAMSYIDSGWHTTVSGPDFMTLKLVMLIFCTLFFIYHLGRLIRKIFFVKEDL